MHAVHAVIARKGGIFRGWLRVRVPSGAKPSKTSFITSENIKHINLDKWPHSSVKARAITLSEVLTPNSECFRERSLWGWDTA